MTAIWFLVKPSDINKIEKLINTNKNAKRFLSLLSILSENPAIRPLTPVINAKTMPNDVTENPRLIK